MYKLLGLLYVFLCIFCKVYVKTSLHLRLAIIKVIKEHLSFNSIAVIAHLQNVRYYASRSPPLLIAETVKMQKKAFQKVLPAFSIYFPERHIPV